MRQINFRPRSDDRIAGSEISYRPKAYRMKRTRRARPARPGPDFEQILQLATGLGLSCCRVEDAYWEARLTTLVNHILTEGDEAVLTTALDHLYNARDRSYDALAEILEYRCETRLHPSSPLSEGSTQSQLLLFNAPLLAWSRYRIPAGPIPAPILTNLRTQLLAHVFADGVKIGLADFLYSPDQLPAGYCETATLTDKLGQAALHQRDLHLDPHQMPETALFLSDTRHLLGVVAVAHGAPIFRWQEEGRTTLRDEALNQWSRQGGEVLRPFLTGCASELLLPQSYHTACRNADRLSRSYSLRASVAFLDTTLNLSAGELRAVIAPFYGQELEEYRIGFTARTSPQVIHGVVWALIDNEEDNGDVAAQIEAELRGLGIGEILHIDHRLPVEYCDDCGTPLYPNPEGEPVHAEMPEEQAEAAPRHLH